MLDSSLKEQLKQVYAPLEAEYVFSVRPSANPKQAELVELLADVAECSSHIKVIEEGLEVRGVQFDLLKNGQPTGVRFRGVPGGHEFTSLVLSILNADGKGKLPDAGILARVAALKGPIHMRTYISLSCTNCPDVVQALNIMALQHAGFQHEMIDGALAEDEIQALGIQGVPAVFSGEKMVHVGKASFGELLEKLEEHFGKAETSAAAAPQTRSYDVVVIGGGPAGASAAIYTARKGLSTAVVATRFGGQVQETMGIENLVSVTHTEGPRLAADLEKHMRSYPIYLLENRKVEKLSIEGKKKIIHLQGGELIETESVIIATGAKWRELGIPGEKEYIGRGVAFCPHCDGPFYKGKRVAVVGGGNSGVEAAIDLANICSSVTLVEFADKLKADEVLVKALHALPNVTVITNGRTSEVVGNGENVVGLKVQDRTTETISEIELDGVFVQIGLVPNSAVFKESVETNRFGEIVVDAKNHTNVPGIYAAGDVTTIPFKQIVIAMGDGAKAALSAFEDRIRA